MVQRAMKRFKDRLQEIERIKMFGEPNNWERSADEYRKRAWRKYRRQWPSFPFNLLSINDGHRGNDIDPCPRCLKLADQCEVYGAFERGWPR